MLLIDQRGFDNPALASAVTLRDSVLKLTFDELSGVYDARLSSAEGGRIPNRALHQRARRR